MKDGKSPGEDNLPSEILKTGGYKVMVWQQQLLSRAMAAEDIPQQWKRSIIISLLKKEDVTLCSKYSPICLLCHAYKLFAKIIHGRMKSKEEGDLGE